MKDYQIVLRLAKNLIVNFYEKILFSNNSQLTKLLGQLLQDLLKHGLIEPEECLQFILALLCDSQQETRQIANTTIAEGWKQNNFSRVINFKFDDGIKLCFDYNQEQIFHQKKVLLPFYVDSQSEPYKVQSHF